MRSTALEGECELALSEASNWGARRPRGARGRHRLRSNKLPAMGLAADTRAQTDEAFESCDVRLDTVPENLLLQLHASAPRARFADNGQRPMKPMKPVL